MAALITSRNKPKVKIVIGMVKNFKMGATILLSKAKISATKIAVF